MEANGEKVLQAIERGITTRPRLRDSTGFTYAQLEIILHGLEFEDQVINHTETADGFPRYSARTGGVMSVTEADQRSAAKKGVSLDPNGHKPKVERHPQRGPAYKELDLAEVEEVMGTEDTIEKGARKLGLTNAQLYVRRGRDKAVDEAVDRGRRRYYKDAPEVDINEVAGNGEYSRTVSEVISDAEECLNVPADAVREAATPRVTEALTALDAKIDEQSQQEDLAAIERVSQIVSPIGGDLHFPPSALLKKIVMDDEFFPGAYDTLVAILDADMSAVEKQAVWTLLQYLKRVEKTHQEACIAAEMAS